MIFSFFAKKCHYLEGSIKWSCKKISRSQGLQCISVGGVVLLASWSLFSSIRANYVQYGEASWYGGQFIGKKTANGEIYTGRDDTCAHLTWPKNSIIMVTNLDNGRRLKVRINDRGPYAKGRIIDLSVAAAEKLAMKEKGVANVKLEMIKRGDDKYKKP